MFWYDHDVSGWGWFTMSVGMILFWAVLIALGVMLFRTLSRSDASPTSIGTPPRGPAGSTAEQLLAERFARGEIDEDEYRHRLAVLHGTGDSGPRLSKS
ncbi:SHOCT domain-containing protein [Streptomyces gilvifuscus]|uniref:SHOCT domain-containing protein n=1 Tax=Streptomyces gilvifuscus TaxID=1550617 RepID=A0ABT5FRR2_9ACTN|nr:SHOCT domain-containing protein [Streptomyces gilvifuscus]MDC2955181.1 SHOCT domain-containing protein [Streptomyces gilvifuscus]